MNRDEYIAEGIVRLQNAIDEESPNIRELAADLASHIQAYGATGNETIDNLVFELTINARNMEESDLIDSAQELIDAFDDFLFEEEEYLKKRKRKTQKHTNSLKSLAKYAHDYLIVKH